MADTSRELIIPVQYLRGLAASLVALGHLMDAVRGYTGNPFPAVTAFLSAIGGAGVDVFFVISGFMMVHIAADESPGTKAAGHFLVRRLLRVVPLYFLYTLLYFVISQRLYGVMPHVLDRSWMDLLRSLTFTQYIGFPVLEVGWTLMYEVYFYLLFALAMIVLAARQRSLVLMVILAALAVLAVCFPATAPGSVFVRGNGFLAFVRNPIVIEFAFGVWVGELYRKGHRLSPGSAGLAMIAAVLLLLLGGALVDEPVRLLQWRALVWGVPGFLLVLGAVALHRQGADGALQRLGDISYSIYLAHPPVMLLVTWWAVAHTDGMTRFMLVVVGGIVATLAVSLLTYRLFEQGFGKWLRRRLGYAMS